MRSGWRKGLTAVGLRGLGMAALATVVLAGSTSTAGCASSRDEIDHVQPLAMKKSDFVGDIHHPELAPEWYMRSLITQVQRTNPWFSEGLQDLTRRIRFEITEDYLVVRNAYEYIKGADGKGGVSANGRQLWLSGRSHRVVYVFDTANGRLLARIGVGNGPPGLCLWPQPGRYSLGHTGNLR